MIDMLTPERIELLALRSRCKDMDATINAMRAYSAVVHAELRRTQACMEEIRRERDEAQDEVRMFCGWIERDGAGLFGAWISAAMCVALTICIVSNVFDLPLWLAGIYVAGGLLALIALWLAYCNSRSLKAWVWRVLRVRKVEPR